MKIIHFSFEAEHINLQAAFDIRQKKYIWMFDVSVVDVNSWWYLTFQWRLSSLPSLLFQM